MINLTKYYNILEAERVTIHDLIQHFKKDELDYDEHGNVFVGFGKKNKGSAILVAHMDNVLHGVREPVMSVDGRYIMGRKTGIGFDDKAGIIADIELYRRLKGKIRIIFTTDEEIGGVSAGKLDPSRFADAKYMIELDRRSNKDLIQNSGSTRLCSDEFALMIEGYGFKRATGTFTDVNKFKGMHPEIEMCNLSIGYYNAHNDNEYLDIEDFNDIVDKVERILRECTGEYVDTQKDEPKTYSYDRYDKSYNSYSYDDQFDVEYCDNCGKPLPKHGYIETIDGLKFCDTECKEEFDKYMNGELDK